MSVTFDSPRKAQTVRSNGQPIGTVYIHNWGYHFIPEPRAQTSGQPFESCYFMTLKEIESNLDRQVKMASAAAIRGVKK